MYFNVFGEKVSRARYKEMLNAAKNRRELIAAQFDRRELIKMGLVTATGLLAPIKGLSARAFPQEGIPNLCAPGNQAASPPTTPFTVPFRMLPVAQTVKSLSPTPTINPNTAAGEARTPPSSVDAVSSAKVLRGASATDTLELSPRPAPANRLGFR